MIWKGGLADCVLAGSKDIIEETRVWKTRLGGNLFTIFSSVLAALEGLHQLSIKYGKRYLYFDESPKCTRAQTKRRQEASLGLCLLFLQILK